MQTKENAMNFSFTPYVKPGSRAKTRARSREADPKKIAVENLLKHLPGEAAALYMAGLDIFGSHGGQVTSADGPTLLIIAAVSLVVLLLVRGLARASTGVIVTSVIAFIIWVYALGGGPFQAYGLELARGMGAFLVVAFSTVVTLLAQYGVIK
jgi:hypothetical protein